MLVDAAAAVAAVAGVELAFVAAGAAVEHGTVPGSYVRLAEESDCKVRGWRHRTSPSVVDAERTLLQSWAVRAATTAVLERGAAWRTHVEMRGRDSQRRVASSVYIEHR